MIDRTLPTSYEHLINQEQYERVLDMMLGYFSNRMQVTAVKDGVAHLRKGENEIQCSLNNLVRILSTQETEADWFEIICTHFDTIVNINVKPTIGTFAEMQAKLTLRVYPADFLPNDEFKTQLITRTDFEGTLTTLVLDLPQTFRPLNRKDITHWTVNEQELFEAAQKNVNQQEVEVVKCEIAESLELFFFFSSDYSPSYLLDFEENASFAIGKFGSLIAIPAKGAAITYPINDDGVMQTIEAIHPLISKFYNEEPGNITLRYYWYYDQTFTIFPITYTKEYTAMKLPEKLYRLFMKNNFTAN